MGGHDEKLKTENNGTITNVQLLMVMEKIQLFQKFLKFADGGPSTKNWFSENLVAKNRKKNH